MTEELLLIKRGYIYEFQPKSEFDGKVYALAVSADSRGAGNIVRIIILSPNPSPECITISNSQFAEQTLYCNCGKVTSTERGRLLREVSKVSDRKMQKIDRQLAYSLGLNPMMMDVENKVYKKLYESLLNRVLGVRYGETDTDED